MVIILNDMLRASKRKQTFHCWNNWWEVVILALLSWKFQFKKGCIGHFKTMFVLDSGVPSTLEQWLGQTRQRVRFFSSKAEVFLVWHPQPPISNIPLNSTPFKNTTAFVFTRVFFPLQCKWGSLWCQSNSTKQTFLFNHNFLFSMRLHY